MSREYLEELLHKPHLRSADKANMQTMLKKIRRGEELSYQEHLNLWAYCSRYGVPISIVRRPAP